MNLSIFLRSRVLTVVAALAGGAHPAFAAHRPIDSAAQQSYQHARERCDLGQTTEDRATCLREAGAAFEARNDLTSDPPSVYQRNAEARCAVLPASEQGDCLARVAGQGYQIGSVAGGGIFKETVTQVIGSAGNAGSASGDSTTYPIIVPTLPPPAIVVEPLPR